MRSSVVLLLLFAAACGNVHSLSLDAGSFATVHGHVDLSTIAAKANGAPLIAGIVWGALPSSHPICFEQLGDPVLATECPDVFGFFPGVVDANVSLDPNGDGHFDLPLTHLPSANALVGTDVSHVAYGTLIVVADTNGDGQLTLVGKGGRGMGGGLGGLDTDAGTPTDVPDGGDTGAPGPSGAEIVDTPLAASFVTLKEDQERLSFREGDFTGLNLFYPAPSCGTPPTGYSILETGAYTDSNASCDTLGLDQTIELRALSDQEGHDLACRAQRQSSRTSQPQLDKPPRNFAEFTQHCIGKDLLVLSPPNSPCSTFAVYALSGCQNDPGCMKPEWDERAAPPGWWPCAQ